MQVSRKVAVRRPPPKVPTRTIEPLPNGVPLSVPWSSTVPGVAGATLWVLPLTFTVCRARLPWRVVVASWYVFWSSSCVIVAPSASSAIKCRLIGRAPIPHPPGKETRARPARATSGPSTRLEARIVFTSSYGASSLLMALPFSAA